MSSIPSLSASALSSVQAGFASLDRAAAEVQSDAAADPTQTPQASDTADLTHASAADFDPMVAGVFDLSTARMQISAGAMLLHYDQRARQDIFDMLRD